MLDIRGLTKHFGGLSAVNNLDMTVKQGEIVGLIGPNGAGKTTVFNLITGFISPSKGQIIFKQADITGKTTHSIAEKGVVRTFQQNAFLPDLTVLQNMLASCHLHPKCGFWEAILNTSGYRKKEQYAYEHAMDILKFLGLDSVNDELVQSLPHGYQRLLGIAMALSANPTLLLLDEPLAGMNGAEVSESLTFINRIRSAGTTVLLVEHNMRAVMELCDRIVVINFGCKIAEGLPDEIRRNKNVIEAYLGTSEDVTKPKRRKGTLRQG
jgi:branched-chain amino acid transport system ATP-binding protein